MNISARFSQKLKDILSKLKLEQEVSLPGRLHEFFRKKEAREIIGLGEFIAKTGLSRENSVLLFTLLSRCSNPFVKPVTIPIVKGRPLQTFRKDGIIEDSALFEIPNDDNEDDEFVPPEDIRLVIAYEVCNEQA